MQLLWQSFGPTPTPAVFVSVSAEATDREVSEQIDEALLYAEATARGWLETDPVIRGRLVRNMLFASGRSAEMGPRDDREEGELFAQALALSMHRTDPVVRQRLHYRLALEATQGSSPTKAELERYRAAHGQRFSPGPMCTLSQVFLSRQRWGEQLDSQALAIKARLSEGESPEPSEAHLLGDPFVHNLSGQQVTYTKLDRLYGARFGAAVKEAPLRQWVGPLASSFGLHFVWVDEITTEPLPPAQEVLDQLARSHAHDNRAKAVALHLSRLRAQYDITVVRPTGEGS